MTANNKQRDAALNWAALKKTLQQAADNPNKFPHVDNKTLLQILFIMTTMEESK